MLASWQRFCLGGRSSRDLRALPYSTKPIRYQFESPSRCPGLATHVLDHRARRLLCPRLGWRGCDSGTETRSGFSGLGAWLADRGGLDDVAGLGNAVGSAGG